MQSLRIGLALILTVSGAQLAGHVVDAAARKARETPTSKRYARVDDYSRIQPVSEIPTVSPDGQITAFELGRSILAEVTSSLDNGQARRDIWIHTKPGQAARNLTQGASDGSGWWGAEWSPDSQQLLMLSSRGGHISPWVWERASDRLRRLPVERINSDGGCRWADSQRLVCVTFPDGEPPTLAKESGVWMDAVQTAWGRATRGESTANVVSSMEFPERTRRILTIDVASGTSRVLATASATRYAWWVSPQTQTVVYVEPQPSTYSYAEQAVLGRPGTLAVMRLDGTLVQPSQPLPTNVSTGTLSLSPDGQEIAFFAYGQAALHPELLYGEERALDIALPRTGTKENPARLWRMHLASGRVEEVPASELDLGRTLKLPTLQWLAAGELLVRGKRLSARADIREVARDAWLVIERGGRLRPLASGDVPDRLWVVENGEAAIGVLREEVVRVDVRTGTVRTLTSTFAPPVHSLREATYAGRRVILRAGTSKDGEWGKFVVKHMNTLNLATAGVQYYMLDLATARVVPIAMPAPTAVLTAFSEGGDQPAALFHQDDRTGTALWRVPAGQAPEALIVTNTFRRGIRFYEERTFDYVGGNGERLVARMVLPAGYSPERRYPLVVDSDIGYTLETAPMMYDLAYRGYRPYQELVETVCAFSDFIYVFVSAPSTGMDNVGRANLLTLPHGILPAVQKAIDLGYADPDRIFLYGGSSFGYGVFGLVTQTSRFKAAVAVAGWTDMKTIGLTARPAIRLQPEAFSSFAGAYYTRRQVAFWRDAETYHRNSPLTYVDRVQTPLLILHGEFDKLPVSQVEMFFQALVQQRKPAELVRYFGEGHGNEIPANVRDEYQRILAWFDRHGDILRDEAGHIVFEGNRAKSRGGAAPLPVEHYGQFEPFQSVDQVGTENLSVKR